MTDLASSASAPRPGLNAYVARMARRLATAGNRGGAGMSTGDITAIRRMDPRQPGSAAVAFERLRCACDIGEADVGRWALVAHSLALAQGRHDGKVAMGRALHDLRFSEARLDALLAADFDLLVDLVPRLARRFNAQAASADWSTMAALIMAVDRHDEAADRARLRIARSYASASGAAKTPESEGRSA